MGNYLHHSTQRTCVTYAWLAKASSSLFNAMYSLDFKHAMKTSG